MVMDICVVQQEMEVMPPATKTNTTRLIWGVWLIKDVTNGDFLQTQIDRWWYMGSVVAETD